MSTVVVERKRVTIEPGQPVDRWLVSIAGVGGISSTENRPTDRRIEQLLSLALRSRRVRVA